MRYEHPTNIVVNLRPIDQRRIAQLRERTETPLPSADIWYIHTVLTQCFLPYKDPKTRDWTRRNGDFSIFLTAGLVQDPRSPTQARKPTAGDGKTGRSAFRLLQAISKTLRRLKVCESRDCPLVQSPACFRAIFVRRRSNSSRPSSLLNGP